MNKFEIVSGNTHEGSLHNQKYAGVSIYKEDGEFYRVQLNIWPNISYFIRKNKSNNAYTIFSRLVKIDDGIKFQNPVGYAKVLERVKTHMILKFEVPNVSLFMSLFPSS